MLKRFVIRRHLGWWLLAAFVGTLVFPPSAVLTTPWIILSGWMRVTGRIDVWERDEADARYWAKVSRGTATYGGRLSR